MQVLERSLTSAGGQEEDDHTDWITTSFTESPNLVAFASLLQTDDKTASDTKTRYELRFFLSLLLLFIHFFFHYFFLVFEWHTNTNRHRLTHSLTFPSLSYASALTLLHSSLCTRNAHETHKTFPQFSLSACFRFTFHHLSSLRDLIFDESSILSH
jgi:hypothetical protein